MKFRILSKTEQEIYDCDAMAICDYTDVSALGASLTGNIALCPGTTNGLQPALGTSGTDTLPATFATGLKYVIVDTPFVSGTATSLTVTVGDSGSANRFLTSSQLQSGQTPITGAVGTLDRYYAGATEVVNAYFTSVTGNLSTFTAGSMRLFFRMEDLNQLPKT